MKATKQRAKQLRKNETDAERLLWYRLRNRQIANSKFRRQHVIEPYIVDFVCLERGLVVEVDGGQHAERVPEDVRRTEFLESKGLRVLRFWNNDVLTQTEAVLESIYSVLLERPLTPPLPKGERGTSMDVGFLPLNPLPLGEGEGYLGQSQPNTPPVSNP